MAPILSASIPLVPFVVLPLPVLIVICVLPALIALATISCLLVTILPSIITTISAAVRISRSAISSLVFHVSAIGRITIVPFSSIARSHTLLLIIVITITNVSIIFTVTVFIIVILAIALL